MRRPVNLSIPIVSDPWTDSEIAVRRHLKSAGRGLRGVSEMLQRRLRGAP